MQFSVHNVSRYIYLLTTYPFQKISEFSVRKKITSHNSQQHIFLSVDTFVMIMSALLLSNKNVIVVISRHIYDVQMELIVDSKDNWRLLYHRNNWLSSIASIIYAYSWPPKYTRLWYNIESEKRPWHFQFNLRKGWR